MAGCPATPGTASAPSRLNREPPMIATSDLADGEYLPLPNQPHDAHAMRPQHNFEDDARKLCHSARVRLWHPDRPLLPLQDSDLLTIRGSAAQDPGISRQTLPQEQTQKVQKALKPLAVWLRDLTAPFLIPPAGGGTASKPSSRAWAGLRGFSLSPHSPPRLDTPRAGKRRPSRLVHTLPPKPAAR